MHSPIEDQLGFGTFQKRQISIIGLGVVIVGSFEAQLMIHFPDTDQFIIFYLGEFLGYITIMLLPFNRTTLLIGSTSILMITCFYHSKLIVLFIGIAISIINPCCEILAGECIPQQYRGRTIIFLHICYALGKSISGVLYLLNLRFIIFLALGIFNVLTYRFVLESFQYLIIREEFLQATEQIKKIAQINNLQKQDYTEEIQLLQLQQDSTQFQFMSVRLTFLFGMISLFSNAQVRMVQLTMAQQPQLISSYYVSDLPSALCAFIIIDLFSNLIRISLILQIISLSLIFSVEFFQIQENIYLLALKIIHTLNGQFLSVICFLSFSPGNRLKGISLYKGLAKTANIIIPFYTSLVITHQLFFLGMVQIIITIFSFFLLLI